MFGRNVFASLFEGYKDPETGEFSSNFILLATSAGFLVVTIGLILLQPGALATRSADATKDQGNLADAPLAATVQNPPPTSLADDNSVARLDTSLFSFSPSSGGATADQPVREPIRLTAGNIITYDLRSLTATVLTDFGHVTRQSDPLHELLVEALANQQSDAYIDALLNTAAGRGDFTVPLSLQVSSGRLDTPTLLQAIKVRAHLK